MNKKLTFLFLTISCLLLTPSVYAQESEKSINGTKEDLDWWLNDASNPNNEALLFKAIWFDDKNPRSSERFEVYCNGLTFYARASVMGTGPSGFTVLSSQQIAAIKQIISDLKHSVVADKGGQRHTAVIFPSSGKFIRSDYWGASPPDFVNQIKAIIDSGTRLDIPKPLSPPEELCSCVADTDKNIDLETISKEELLKRAFRPYLYPSERYKILKVYLGRFPNDTDGMTNFLRRWVAVYEGAQK